MFVYDIIVYYVVLRAIKIFFFSSPMNALIHEVLSKKATNNTEIKLIVKTLVKPKIITNVSCSVTVDDPFIFYTFDGRSLFFSEEETEPSISIPDETKHVEFLSMEEKAYVFMLSSKNKLECCDLEPTLSKSRYIINRNVVKIQKSGGNIYYMFKKDQGYFINECFFDGKKWIGKTLCAIPSSGKVDMFATGGNVYYINEGKVFNTSGDCIGVNADYIHRCKDTMVTGSFGEDEYAINVLDINAGYSTTDTFILPSEDVVLGIEAHENILILKMKDRLILFKIDVNNKKFEVVWSMKYETEVYDVGFSVNENTVILYKLSDQSSSDVEKLITESNMQGLRESNNEDLVSKEDDQSKSLLELNKEEDQSKSLLESNKEDDQTKPLSESESINSSEFFYEDKEQPWDTKKSSILKEMESLSIVPKNRDNSSPTKPKSNLLEEVKATLNKKKSVVTNPTPVETQKSASEDLPAKPLETFSDRFEIFRKANLSKSKNINTIEETVAISSPKKTNASVKEDKLMLKPENFSNIEPLKQTNSNDDFIRNSKAEKILNQLSIQCKEIMEQVKIQKEVQTKSIIKEVVISHLIPCVEACFNEMRIQMMTEIRKILSTSICHEDSKIASIKELLANRKSTQAINEFLKLDDDGINSHLHLLTPAFIESADTAVVFELLVKVSKLVKFYPTELHFNLIATCLMEIEVGTLNVEDIQELSVLIRSIKELESFDKERYPDLNCVMEIISKKIRKRAKQGNNK